MAVRQTLTRLKVIRESISENKLEDFDLHWFTKKRLEHIDNLLENLDGLEELGFEKDYITGIRNTLLEIKEGYELRHFWHLVKRHKKRKELNRREEFLINSQE